MVDEHIVQNIARAICRIVAQGPTCKGYTIPQVAVNISKGHLNGDKKGCKKNRRNKWVLK